MNIVFALPWPAWGANAALANMHSMSAISPPTLSAKRFSSFPRAVHCLACSCTCRPLPNSMLQRYGSDEGTLLHKSSVACMHLRYLAHSSNPRTRATVPLAIIEAEHGSVGFRDRNEVMPCYLRMPVLHTHVSPKHKHVQTRRRRDLCTDVKNYRCSYDQPTV